jgi:hypothetical protein
MSTATRALYEGLVKAASSFKDKNFRQYFVRIVEDDFARFSKEASVSEAEFIKRQQENLQVLERQALIHNMYYSDSFSVKR